MTSEECEQLIAEIRKCWYQCEDTAGMSKKYVVETDGFPTEIVDDIEICLIKMHALMQLHHVAINKNKGPTYYVLCLKGEWPDSPCLKADITIQPIKTIEGILE